MIYETVYIGGGRIPLHPGSILRQAGLAWHIDFVTRMKGIPCWKQSTLAAVRALTGRANYDTTEAKKAATIEACLARGWKAGQHAADALALLMFAESRLYPEAARKRRMVLKRPRGPLFTSVKRTPASGSVAGELREGRAGTAPADLSQPMKKVRMV